MGHRHLGRARRRRPRDRRRARRPGHRARGPRRHRLEHALRVGPGRPRRHGEPAARRRRSTRRRWPTTSRSSSSDSGAKVVFAENAEQLEKLRGIRGRHPGVMRVIVFDGSPTPTRGPSPSTRCASSAASTSRATPARSTRASTASSPTSSRRSSTPRARPAAPRACGCGTARGPTRAPPSSRSTSSSEDDLQYLWLPLAHVFGKVLLTLPLQIGFPTAIDGRIDKIVDNLAVVQADLHGRRAAHLREGLRPDPDDDGRRGRRQGTSSSPGPAGSAARSASCASRARTPRGCSACKYAIVRQAHRHQDPRPLRWTDPLLHLRLGRAQPGRRALVRRHGDADRRGLRHDRDQRGLVRQPDQGLPVRHGRLAAARHRDPHRRGRRGAAARPGQHGGLPQQPRGDRRDASTPRAGCTPATSASSTTAASCGSPTARRTCSRPAAASTSRRRSSSRRSRACAPTPASSSSTAPTATSSPRWSPSTPRRSRAGRAQHGMEGAGLRRDRHAPTPAARWCRATSTSSTRA